MKAPSVKRLVETFKLSSADARKVRALAHLADDAEKLEAFVSGNCPATDVYARSCHTSPWDSYMWRVAMALHAIDAILNGYGVEGLGPPGGRSYAPPFEYVNFGDAYATTLIYCRAVDELRIGCWGDIAEKHPEWP